MKIESIDSTTFAVNGNYYAKGDYSVEYRNNESARIRNKYSGQVIDGLPHVGWTSFTNSDGSRFENYVDFTQKINSVVSLEGGSGSSAGNGYYAGVLAQSGTGIPTLVGVNNTDMTFTWTRTAVGTYLLTSDANLDSKKLACFVQSSNFVGDVINIQKIGNYFRVKSYSEGVLTDGILQNASIKIEFYN